MYDLIETVAEAEAKSKPAYDLAFVTEFSKLADDMGALGKQVDELPINEEVTEPMVQEAQGLLSRIGDLITKIKDGDELLGMMVKWQTHFQHFDDTRLAEELRRQEESDRLTEQCDDQPAGVPKLIRKHNLIVAAGYTKKGRQKKLSKKAQAELYAQQTAAAEEAWERQRLSALRRIAVLEQEKPSLKRDMKIRGLKQRYLEDGDPLGPCYVGKWVERNNWFSRRLNAYVVVYESRLTGKCRAQVYRSPDPTGFKLDIYQNTYEAAEVYTLEAEARAMELLKSKVTEEQYRKYVLTGMLMEQSKKSGLWYIFRRLRPTLVFRHKVEDKKRYKQFVAALCAHSQGYYACSWAGTLVPTDDIVTHLLLMRADERMFWRKATQHDRFSPQADI